MPIAVFTERVTMTTDAEKTLHECHPSMFRNRPILFSVCVLLILAYGLGLLILFLWWLGCRSTTLTITNKRTTLRKGIFSKYMTEVWHKDVRNLQLGQSLGQRLFGTGMIGISSAGQSDVEIKLSGIPKPGNIRELIDAHRGQ